MASERRKSVQQLPAIYVHAPNALVNMHACVIALKQEVQQGVLPLMKGHLRSSRAAGFSTIDLRNL